MIIKQDYNWVVTVTNTEYWRDISCWNNEATTLGVESFSWLIKKVESLLEWNEDS